MANNRIAVVCDVCKLGASIGKYYPSSSWYLKEDAPKIVDDFVTRHGDSCGAGEYDISFRKEIEAPGKPDTTWNYEHLVQAQEERRDPSV